MPAAPQKSSPIPPNIQHNYGLIFGSSWVELSHKSGQVGARWGKVGAKLPYTSHHTGMGLGGIGDNFWGAAGIWGYIYADS